LGYPTKVQLIKRKESEQWYINFPSAVARAMEFQTPCGKMRGRLLPRSGHGGGPGRWR